MQVIIIALGAGLLAGIGIGCLISCSHLSFPHSVVNVLYEPVFEGMCLLGL